MNVMLTVIAWTALLAGTIGGAWLLLSAWWVEWQGSRRHPDVWELVQRGERWDS